MSRSTLMARALLLVALAAVAALGAACGGDSGDGGEEAASAEEVAVTATEYEFDLSATPSADTQTVTLSNDGQEPHALVFARVNEGFTTEEAIRLEGGKGSAEEIGQAFARPGASDTLNVKRPLEAGPYAMLCPLETKDGEPHYELGQLEEFAIE